MQSFNKKLFLNNVYAILKEAVHDANIGRYGSVGPQSPTSSDQTLGGVHLKGGDIYPYISPPTTISDADDLDEDELDYAINAIAAKTDGSSSSLPIIDPPGLFTLTTNALVESFSYAARIKGAISSAPAIPGPAGPGMMPPWTNTTAIASLIGLSSVGICLEYVCQLI